MKQILFFSVLAILASSCTKKVHVAAFAPTSVNAETAKSSVNEVQKQRVMHEVLPPNNVNQPAQQHVQQTSLETSLLTTATQKVQKKASILHIDRILDTASVKSYIQKTSFKNQKAAPRGARYWAPQLKIGLTLLAIGVVLAVFGLGFVGGLAALIGLCFTIVGLLVTY